MTTKLDFTIGLPPSDSSLGVEQDAIVNSLPIAKIRPRKPKFTTGLSTFSLEKTDRYFELLSSHGYTLPNKYLTVAFLADSFPTDSFQNNYSESFLQGISSGVSQGMSTLTQTLGVRKGSEGAEEFLHATADIFKQIGLNSASPFLDKAAKWTGNAGKRIKEVAANTNGVLGNIAKVLDTVTGGSRFDFPMIWTDSSFQPSYTMTIRLYNPLPGDAESTDKYIIGPLAALLLLGLPISDDPTGSTYNYPFLHQILCEGIYFLNPCFISNISVIKGGDQQQIAFNQRMGIVDVRLDFGSLYSSMLATDKVNNHRPTLRSYLDAMKTEKQLQFDGNVPETDFIQPTSYEYEDFNSDPFNPISQATIDSIPSRVPEDVDKKEYTILSNLVGDLGSLKKVKDSGYVITKKTSLALLTNGIVSTDDVLSIFPDINLPDIKVPSMSDMTNMAKQSMGVFSGLGASASALVNTANELNELEKQLTEMMDITEGDILPPIYFDGKLLGDNLTKSQVSTLISKIKSKKNSLLDTVGSAVNRMMGETSYLGNLSSNMNNIAGVTDFISKSVGFSSLTDLMDKLKPGNILDGAKNILGDMISSGLKFNTNNMFSGIISSISDKFQQMDILKSIISKGIDFAGKFDVIDMIRNGIDFDPKSILLNMVTQGIDFNSTGILGSLLHNQNLNFDATSVLRQVISPTMDLKNTISQFTNYRNILNNLKGAATDIATNELRNLQGQLLDGVKNTLHLSSNATNINPLDFINKTEETVSKEVDKGKMMIHDFLKKEIHTILI